MSLPLRRLPFLPAVLLFATACGGDSEAPSAPAGPPDPPAPPPTRALTASTTAPAPLEVVTLTGATALTPGSTRSGTLAGESVTLTVAEDGALVLLVPEVAPGSARLEVPLPGGEVGVATLQVQPAPAIPAPEQVVETRVQAFEDAMGELTGLLEGDQLSSFTGLGPDDAADVQAWIADVRTQVAALSPQEQRQLALFFQANRALFESLGSSAASAAQLQAMGAAGALPGDAFESLLQGWASRALQIESEIRWCVGAGIVVSTLSGGTLTGIAAAACVGVAVGLALSAANDLGNALSQPGIPESLSGELSGAYQAPEMAAAPNLAGSLDPASPTGSEDRVDGTDEAAASAGAAAFANFTPLQTRASASFSVQLRTLRHGEGGAATIDAFMSAVNAMASAWNGMISELPPEIRPSATLNVGGLFRSGSATEGVSSGEVTFVGTTDGGVQCGWDGASVDCRAPDLGAHSFDLMFQVPTWTGQTLAVNLPAAVEAAWGSISLSSTVGSKTFDSFNQWWSCPYTIYATVNGNVPIHFLRVNNRADNLSTGANDIVQEFHNGSDFNAPVQAPPNTFVWWSESWVTSGDPTRITWTVTGTAGPGGQEISGTTQFTCQ